MRNSRTHSELSDGCSKNLRRRHPRKGEDVRLARSSIQRSREDISEEGPERPMFGLSSGEIGQESCEGVVTNAARR